MVDKRTISRMFEFTIKVLNSDNSQLTKWDKFVAWKVGLGLKKGVILDINEPETYKNMRKDFNNSVENRDDF